MEHFSGAYTRLRRRRAVMNIPETDIERTRKGSPMPAKSKAQQKAAGAALSAKRGETSERDLKGASREMYASMNESELQDLAETSRAGKPEHVRKSD